MPPSVAHSFLRVRKNEEFSSKLKCRTHGVHVPVQVARVYIHNTPEGICYRFLYVRLGSLSAASTSTVAVQTIKGFTRRAERLEEDRGGFTDNRMKGECQDIVILNRKQVPSTGYFHRSRRASSHRCGTWL